MLKRIKVTPIAAESLGVRSMCTLVETPDVTVLLDAGISLAPYRFNLLPNPVEFHTIKALRCRISEAADKAQVVTISHYHFDHHTPSYEDWLVNWTQEGETARQIYADKIIIMKNPKEKINDSQRQRAWMFQKTGGKYAKKLEVADGKTFKFAETIVRFSEAVPHGSENGMLGWVVISTIQYEGEKFMHAPDVQGPVAGDTYEFIKSEKPDMLMIGGPPFYLSGLKVEESQIRSGIEHLRGIVKVVSLTIFEHHALRASNWRQKVESVYESAKVAGHQVITAAEFLGQPNLFLESQRKQLYVDNPPSDEFKRWMKIDSNELIRVRPPI